MGSTQNNNKRISSPIGAALFGTTRQAVLRLFFTHPDERFYQRQVMHALQLGSGGVQRELEALTTAGILNRSTAGRQTYYEANTQCPVFNDLHGLITKTFGVPRIIEINLRPLAKQIEVAFVYGSFAAGKENAKSDVDVMIVGDDISLGDAVAALATAQDELKREVTPTVYRSEEFSRKLKEKNHFLSQVSAGPKIFVIGDEHDLSRLAERRLAKTASKQPARNRRSSQSR